MANDERSQSGKARRGPGRAGAVGRSEGMERGETVIPNPKAKLLDQLREVMRLKHYSLRTERSYRDWVRRFVKFHGMRSREDLEPAEAKIELFLSHLAVEGHVAASTQNQAFNALLFLYREVVHRPLENINAVRADRPVRVPTVLTAEERGGTHGGSSIANRRWLRTPVRSYGRGGIGCLEHPNTAPGPGNPKSRQETSGSGRETAVHTAVYPGAGSSRSRISLSCSRAGLPRNRMIQWVARAKAPSHSAAEPQLKG